MVAAVTLLQVLSAYDGAGNAVLDVRATLICFKIRFLHVGDSTDGAMLRDICGSPFMAYCWPCPCLGIPTGTWGQSVYR